ACRYLVEYCRHLVIVTRGIHDVVLERLRRQLQLPAVPAHQRDLMRTSLRDRIRQFDCGVAVFNRAPGRRRESVERSTRSFQRSDGLPVQLSARIARIESLEPRRTISPARWVVTRDANRRDAVLIHPAEALRHPQ